VVGTAKGGIKIVSGVGGAMSDNNLFALAMVMALPFCWYCIQQTPLIALKAVLLAMFFGAIGTVIFAQSRGSILAMGAVLMLIILQSRRRLLLTLLIAGLALPVLLLTWDQVAKRMATLNDPTQDGSAWSRIEHIRGGIAVWRDHPLFGIGPGDENLARIAGGYGLVAGQALHNTPVQVLAHFGAFGLLCWLNLFGSAVFLAWRSTRRMNRIRPDLAGMPRAVLTSLLGFLSGCLVYPRAYFEYGYLFAAYVGCWLLAEKSLLALPSVDRLPVEPMAPPELPPVATAPEPLETQAPDNPVLVRPPRKRRR
jgi:O-antigen ligase